MIYVRTFFFSTCLIRIRFNDIFLFAAIQDAAQTEYMRTW